MCHGSLEYIQENSIFVSFISVCSLLLSLQEWKVTRLTFEYDPEPYGKERDAAIIKMAQEFRVETIVRNSHTLYNLDRYEQINKKS